MRARRRVTFTPTDLVRVREAARALGITYDEFIVRATLQACDEVAAGDQEIRLRRALSRSPFRADHLADLVDEDRAERADDAARGEAWQAGYDAGWGDATSGQRP